jgi:hypothetical protein
VITLSFVIILRSTERDAFACIERHQAFAMATVWCDPRADARGTGCATHRISSYPLLALFASNLSYVRSALIAQHSLLFYFLSMPTLK